IRMRAVVQHRTAVANGYLLRYESALHHAREALIEAELAADPRYRESYRITVARCLILLGRLREARMMLRDAPAPGGELERSYLFGARAECFRVEGYRAEAARWFARAYRIKRKLGDKPAAATALASLLHLEGLPRFGDRWTARGAELLQEKLPRRARLELQIALLARVSGSEGREALAARLDA